MCYAIVISTGTVGVRLFTRNLMNCVMMLFATGMSVRSTGNGKVCSCGDCTCVLCIFSEHFYCGPVTDDTMQSGRLLQVLLVNELSPSLRFYLYLMVTKCDKLSITVNVAATEEPEGVASATKEDGIESQRKRKLDISVNSEKS